VTSPLAVFDFDGTLADSLTAAMGAYNSLAPRLHLRTVSEAEVPALRGMEAHAALKALGVPLWKLPRLLVEIRAELGRRLDELGAFTGVREALRVVREGGCRCAVVSSNSAENVRRFLDRHDMGEFEPIAAGSSMFGKASRLRRLLRTARVSPAQAAYIADTLTDIRASRAVGLASIAVTWGANDDDALAAARPDALVRSSSELAAAVLHLLRPSMHRPAAAAE
jgi:phosphoglycolate phosphatase